MRFSLISKPYPPLLFATFLVDIMPSDSKYFMASNMLLSPNGARAISGNHRPQLKLNPVSFFCEFITPQHAHATLKVGRACAESRIFHSLVLMKAYTNLPNSFL